MPVVIGVGLTGVEPVIDTIIGELRAYLPARLAALQAEYGNTVVDGRPQAIPLIEPANIVFGERATMSGHPWVELYPVGSDIEDDNVRFIDVVHEIALGIFTSDADEEILTRKLLRYTRGIAETMMARRSAIATLGAGIRLIGRWDYSPTRVAERNVYDRDAFITVRARTRENRT
jgi:hypothetical protein